MRGLPVQKLQLALPARWSLFYYQPQTAALADTGVHTRVWNSLVCQTVMDQGQLFFLEDSV